MGGASSGGNHASAGAAGAEDAPSTTGGAAGASAEAGAASTSGGSSGAGGTVNPSSEGGSAGDVAAPDPGKQYPDIDFVYDPPKDVDPVTPGNACASKTLDTAPIPLDMYVVLDRSGSMNLPQTMPIDNVTPGTGDCNVGDATVSRWCRAINSLDGFFGSEVAAGTGVALQFFPAGGCTNSASPLLFGCCDSGSCCGGGAEAKPAVALADLPAARAPLAEALNAATPWADRTPIEAALRGMINYTAGARRAGRQMMGVLVTDGGPEGCATNSASLATLVANHRAKTGIPTYVVGTQGAAYSWLQPIAVAGGAPTHTDHCAGGVKPCNFYDVGSAKSDVFIDVLQQIRRSAIACTYAVPPADSGLPDLKDVSLSVTPQGGKATRIEQVSGVSACKTGGFYYDDPAKPKTIQLCPNSCDALRAADGGRVEILIGCQGS